MTINVVVDVAKMARVGTLRDGHIKGDEQGQTRHYGIKRSSDLFIQNNKNEHVIKQNQGSSFKNMKMFHDDIKLSDEEQELRSYHKIKDQNKSSLWKPLL